MTEKVITIEIYIRNTSDQPIYEQIYTQLKEHILAGRLREGEALPSIRALAKDLRVSIITTKRAYDELEREGFINTVAGKGCFVAPKNVELIREQTLKEIESHLRESIRLAALCGLSYVQLQEMLSLLHEEDTP